MKLFFIAICSLPMVAKGANIQNSSLFNLDGSNPDALILNFDGLPVSAGFVALGVFSVNDATVSNNAATAVTTGDFSPLVSNFTSILGTDDFQTGVDFIFGIGDVPGAYAMSGSIDPTAFIGQTLYTFIGDGVDLANSNYFALYKHSETLTADPGGTSPPNSYNLLLDGGQLIVGTSGQYLSTDANLGTSMTSVNSVTLVGVPEPSALLLSAFGALTLLRRKP